MCKKIALSILVAVLIPCSASALQVKDLLSLVTMPLAVAAVSDLAGVSQNDLVNVVTALNQANVPPPQFVEIVRYVPVALVDSSTAPQFVQFVDTQSTQLPADAFAMAIADRLRSYGATQIDVVAPRFVPVEIVEQPIVQPQVVQTPIVEPQRIVVRQPVVVQPQTRVVHVVRHEHPHGGPPGQLKKIVGVQTGAQIVHRGRGHEKHVVIAQPAAPVFVQPQPVVVQQEGRGHGEGEGHGHGKGKH